MNVISLKNKIFQILNSKILYHLYFWGIAYLAYLAIVLLILEDKSFGFSIMYSFWQVALCSIPVYINFYIVDKLLPNKKYILYGIFLIGIIFLSSFLLWSFFVWAFNDRFKLYNYLFEITFFVIGSSFLKFIKSVYNQRLEMQEMKTKQIQTELNLLKAQINPHFIFNTLNNLFGLSRKQDQRTSTGIFQLSHLLRYMIYNSKEDKIALEQEIEQIHRLIDLEMLGFSKEDDIKIDFQFKGNVKEYQIPPTLLVPFIENAFKHGISIEDPSFLKIDLIIEKQNLYFSVINSITNHKRIDNKIDSGEGLKNVKRRLELLYPESHDLKILENKKTFKIELTLSN